MYYYWGMHGYWWVFWIFLWILFFSFSLVGEVCGSPIRSSGRRKLGSCSPRTRCGMARLQLSCS